MAVYRCSRGGGWSCALLLAHSKSTPFEGNCFLMASPSIFIPENRLARCSFWYKTKDIWSPRGSSWIPSGAKRQWKKEALTSRFRSCAKHSIHSSRAHLVLTTPASKLCIVAAFASRCRSRKFRRTLNLTGWRLLLHAKYPDLGGRQQPCVHHLFHHRRQAGQVLSGVDNRNQNGLIVARETMLMHLGCLAVTFETAEDGGAGDLHLPALIHDGLIQRLPAVAVGFRNVNSQQLSGLYRRHRRPPSRSCCAPA